MCGLGDRWSADARSVACGAVTFPRVGGEGALSGRWRRVLPDAVVACLTTALALGPLLPGRGFVLVGDMVFVPDQPWKDAWIGGDGGVPRAVPSDAWVSLATSILPGDVLQRLVLVAIFLGAAVGVSRLTSTLPFLARAAAMVLFVWNPYVHERLAIGHWALLCGYAALPWVAWAVVRLREPADGSCRRRPWVVLVVALAAAAWTSPTGGVMVAVAGVVLAIGVRPLFLRTGGVAAFVNLPWIVPAFGNGADQVAPDAFGVDAFAARADTPFGTLGSLVTFGGIWKESIVPEDRGQVLLAGVGLVVVLLGFWGLWVGRTRPVLPLTPALLLSGGSILVAVVGAMDGLRPVVEWIVVHVPGGGLLRDGQKWVAPWALVACTGVAQAVTRLVQLSTRHSPWGQTWLLGVVLAPVMALPSFALGLGGFLDSDRFPQEWDEVRTEMEARGVAGEQVVVLPFSTYRRFDWTPRTVLDPAPRFFPGRMVTEDALTVPGGTVGGESALAVRIRGAQTSEELTRVLSDVGIGWALVHRSTDPGPQVLGGQEVVANRQLSLVRLAEPTGEPTFAGGWRPTAYAVLDLGVLLGTVCGVGWLALRSMTKRPLRGQGLA